MSSHPILSDTDAGAAARKQDHIELALRSQVAAESLDRRFYYEPMLSAHPLEGSLPSLSFLGHTLRAPLWVSSMTGGTAKAKHINQQLARACGEFGMGMGLGSCRQLLFSDEYLSDFQVRQWLGNGLPLYANLGVAQIEQLFATGEEGRMGDLLEKLQADGLIVHVNPFQEAMQPGGDRFAKAPLETIEQVLEWANCPIIVKEVGQGMGPESLRTLLRLPLAAIEFAAAGGTNFALLELLRDTPKKQEVYAGVARAGHQAAEMLGWCNTLVQNLGDECRTKNLIVSGGIRDFLDGHYLISQSTLPAVYGQASGFLKHAQGDYETLADFVRLQLRGLELANAYLRVRTPIGAPLP